MSDLLKKCEQYYDTRDFYEVLKVHRDATVKEIKKAYHKLSLFVHPDRVEENKKTEATEKFKVLGKIHSVLQDPEKRKIYDDCGDFDEENDSGFNWMDYWTSMFKRISTKDIENYKKEYIGSDEEIRDIKKAYISSKGNMDHIFEMVPFINCESEPRIINVVWKLVDAGEVEEYDCFFNESKRKKDRRRRKLEQEAEEHDKMKITDQELEMEIQKNHEKRKKEFCSFLSNLEAKYSKKGDSKRKSIKQAGPSPAKKRSTKSKK